MSGPGVVLEVSSLAKSYGDRPAVSGISFQIRAGEIFGLLGPNGAGKTTTIGMIATVIRPTDGEVRVSERSARSEREEVRNKIGLVPQRVCLYPSLTAEENLRFFGKMFGLRGALLDERMKAMLHLAGLESRSRDPVATFSGGMQRRLNLACGLIHEPELLLLDEPTVGVDPQSRERIFTSIEALASRGLAILYTTHYMEEAERLCARVAILDEGRVVAEGTPAELSRLVGGEQIILLFFKSSPSPRLAEKLGERGAKQDGPHRFRLVADSAERLIPELLHLVSSEGGLLGELAVHRANLGEVFLHLTGKELRD